MIIKNYFFNIKQLVKHCNEYNMNKNTVNIVKKY